MTSKPVPLDCVQGCFYNDTRVPGAEDLSLPIRELCRHVLRAYSGCMGHMSGIF